MGITLNGTNVSAWADQSGTGDANKNLSQSTASQQPAYNTSDAAYNGQPTVSFAGASSQVLVAGTWATAPTTVGSFFFVGNADGSAFSEVFNSFTAAGGIGETYQTGTANHIQYYQGSGLDVVVSTLASKHLYGVDRNGGSSAFYQDAVTAVGTGAAGSSALTTLLLGANTSAGGTPLTGKIAEFISVNRLATVAERTKVLNYLGGRYNISIGP
jgi:hypothetical protein